MKMDPAQAVEKAALSYRQAIDKITAREDSDVQRFYEDAVVFLTGGTGFLGKQLLEKLCRSCKISKFFILLRPKKGKNIKDRLAEMLQEPVFDTLREQKPDFTDRIVGVEGGISDTKLGLGDEDWNTVVVEVDIIFHMAAITKFDEKLKTATLVNVKGGSRVIELAKACEKLRSGLRLFPVMPSYHEPSPGWLDMNSIFGATGVFLGIGLGVINTLFMRAETNVDYVPCDYVNNAVLVAGRDVPRHQRRGGADTKIYNIVSYNRNLLTADQFQTYFRDGYNLQTPKAVYYAHAYQYGNKFTFTIATWLFQLLPAYFVDFILLLMNKKRRAVSLYKKIYKASLAFSYFLSNEWKFTDSNTEELFNSLSADDRTIFNFDITSVDWREYIKIIIIGLRKYILKDGLKDTDRGVRKQFWLRILHYVIATIYIYGLCKLIKFIFDVLSVISI